MVHKSRSEQLVFCKKCLKRDFNPKKGIVCSLTGEHATFILECDDFKLDKEEGRKIDTKAKLEKEYKDKNETFGLNKLGVKNKTAAGIVVILLVLLANIVTLILFGRIFIIYSVIIIVLGVKSILIGIKEKNNTNTSDNDILDDL